MKKFVYLDHAATTPVDPVVLKAMEPYWSDKFYNPSAQYAPAKAVAKDLLAARARIAHWLGAKPNEIIFTAGGTEANNLAIHGIMAQYPGCNLIVSSIEHEAALEPAKKYLYHQLSVSKDGLVDDSKLPNLIDDQTVLVSIMYANNEIGTIQPLRQLGQQIAAIRQQRKTNGNHLPLYFHTDAAQAAAYLDLHVARLGVDMMSINGSKIYGPKQSGALFVKSNIQLDPLVLGGGQERGMRSGTENVPGCIGLAAALDLVQASRPAETKRSQDLQALFIKGLMELQPKAVINGSLKHRLPNNIHATFAGHDNERLQLLLEDKRILCATGSACSAASSEASHVLTALGLDRASARASLRFTMGRSTSKEDLESTLAALKTCL